MAAPSSGDIADYEGFLNKQDSLAGRANPNVKLMLNYGRVNNDEFATGKDDQFLGDNDFDYVQMRFQTAFQVGSDG